jgi:hypothetical protein
MPWHITLDASNPWNQNKYTPKSPVLSRQRLFEKNEEEKTNSYNKAAEIASKLNRAPEYIDA